MTDNLKKKKADRKRIALKQRHERAYIKRIAKEMLEILNADKKMTEMKLKLKNTYILLYNQKGVLTHVRTDKLIRCLKALLKLLKWD